MLVFPRTAVIAELCRSLRLFVTNVYSSPDSSLLSSANLSPYAAKRRCLRNVVFIFISKRKADKCPKVRALSIVTSFLLICVRHFVFYTRWFKYDQDNLRVNKSQFVPVIFEPPCINIKRDVYVCVHG
jgi:hypothetical protein